MSSRKLTIGMATYDDYSGVYFSIQSIRMFHPEVVKDIEVVVVDNNPTSKAGQQTAKLLAKVRGKYFPFNKWQGTTVRNKVFEFAVTPFVMCMDSHVLFEKGALRRLLDFFESNPSTNNLYHGPLLYDNLVSISTHMEPKWNDNMFGVWATDDRGKNSDADPFEIPMQGMGVFACRKEAWPGFHPQFRGFGGEEGYIHEKFRQRGGQTICLPFLRWVHRFGYPEGPAYRLNLEDRVRNYLIGWMELGKDIGEVIDHFSRSGNRQKWEKLLQKVKSDLTPSKHLVACELQDAKPSVSKLYYANIQQASRQRIFAR